jgi:hypothetical protein
LYQYLRQREPEMIAACPRGVLAGRFCLLRLLHSSCLSLSHSFRFRLSHSCCLSRQRILPRETGRPKCGPGRSAEQGHDLAHRVNPELGLNAFRVIAAGWQRRIEALWKGGSDPCTLSGMGCCAPHGGQCSELPWLGGVIGMSMGPHQLCTPDSHARCILDEFRLVRLIPNAEESKPSMDGGQLGGKSGMDGEDSGNVGGIVGICAGSRLCRSRQLVGCRVVDRRTCRISECGCSRCWYGCK